MNDYTCAEFQEHYGDRALGLWDVAMVATTGMYRCIRWLEEADSGLVDPLWIVLKACMPANPTVQEARDTLTEAFYIPLRFRAEYLQRAGVSSEEWLSRELAGEKDQEGVWSDVKNHVWNRMMSEDQ